MAEVTDNQPLEDFEKLPQPLENFEQLPDTQQYTTDHYYIAIRSSGDWVLKFVVDKPNGNGEESHTFIFDTEDEALQWRKDHLNLIYEEDL